MRNVPNSSNDLQDIIKRKNEQIEIVKDMVVDRDKTIKKMEEAHMKEINVLQKEKKATDDNLSCATEENTKLKDKEKTLLDIFKCMKQYMDEQLNKSSSPDSSGSGSDNYSCNGCGQRFINIGDLSLHNRTEHVLSLKICQTCRFEAKSNYEYENHVKTHTNMKSHVCGVCQFSASNGQNLSSHLRTKHSKQKCDHCNFLANKEIDLDEHIQQTHGACSKQNQKFYCDECMFADYSEEKVLNHKIEKHSINICELCDFETTSEENMKEHVQETHKQTKFPCNICAKSFKTHRSMIFASIRRCLAIMLAQFLSNAPKIPLGVHRWVTWDAKKHCPYLGY